MAVTVARERGYAVNEALVPAQSERLVHSSQNWLEPFVTGEVSINEAIGQSYRAVGFGAAGGKRTAKTDAMVYLLAGRQHTSGFWPSYSRRPPLEDSEVTATAVTIRALRLFPIPERQAEIDARIAGARVWLTRAAPETMEDRTLQLLGLAWAGATPSELKTQADALVGEQRADGGWAQIATRGSDAYATGQALVALTQAAGVSVHHPAIVRGLAYLQSNQQQDGSWLVETRRTFRDGLPYFETGYPHGKHQFISYAGAAWATIALALADHDRQSPSLMGRPPAREMPVGPSAAEDGLTPLMRAAMFGTLAEMNALLAAGADVNGTSPIGLTALMCAAHDPAKVRRLLDAGADPAKVTTTGHTALLLAAGYDGASESVDLLLGRGAAVDVPVVRGNLPGVTALTRAVMRGDRKMAAQLVAHGARIDGIVPSQVGPIHGAALQGDAEMVAWLADRGAKLDARLSDDFGDGVTPLMIAGEDGRTAVVTELLKRGADVNAADTSGGTALLYAAIAVDRGTTTIVDALLAAGAKRDVTDPKGHSLTALAERWGKPHVAAHIAEK